MMHPALWLSMAALVLVVGYAVWLLVIARGAGIDPYDRLDSLGPDAMGRDWSPHVEPQDWPERPRRRAG